MPDKQTRGCAVRNCVIFEYNVTHLSFNQDEANELESKFICKLNARRHCPMHRKKFKGIIVKISSLFVEERKDNLHKTIVIKLKPLRFDIAN